MYPPQTHSGIDVEHINSDQATLFNLSRSANFDKHIYYSTLFLYRMYMYIQEETLMVLSFAKELSSSATVEVVLSNADDKEDPSSSEHLSANRVNPYTYTCIAPSGQQQSFTSLRLFHTVAVVC